MCVYGDHPAGLAVYSRFATPAVQLYILRRTHMRIYVLHVRNGIICPSCCTSVEGHLTHICTKRTIISHVFINFVAEYWRIRPMCIYIRCREYSIETLSFTGKVNICTEIKMRIHYTAERLRPCCRRVVPNDSQGSKGLYIGVLGILYASCAIDQTRKLTWWYIFSY